MLFLSHPKKDTVRVSIIVMAIAASLGLVVILSSLSVGVRESSRNSIERIGADFYVVPEDLHPLLMDLQRFDQGWDVQRNIEQGPFEIDLISPRLTDTLFFDSNNNLGEVMTIGVDPDSETGFDQFTIVKGDWFSTGSDHVRKEYLQNGTPRPDLMTMEILISRELSREIGVKVGDEITISSSLKGGNGRNYLVEGIYVDSLSRLSRSAMVHLGELQYMKGLQENDTLTEILIDLPEGEDKELVKSWSEGNDFAYRDIVDLIGSQEMLDEIYGFLGVIDGFAIMVIFVTLFVCFIFTSTVFVISAKERLRDTSILRAIGIPMRRISQWILMESALYYVGGLIVGFSFGYFSILILNDIVMERLLLIPEGFTPFIIDFKVVITASIITMILSLLSSIFPAFITYRRSPMDALRGDIG